MDQSPAICGSGASLNMHQVKAFEARSQHAWTTVRRMFIACAHVTTNESHLWHQLSLSL